MCVLCIVYLFVDDCVKKTSARALTTNNVIFTSTQNIIISGMIKTCGALTKKTLDAAKKSDPSDSLKIDSLPALFKK